MAIVEVGRPFPEFELWDQDGNSRNKSDLLGKKSIIFFYPKDDTPG